MSKNVSFLSSDSKSERACLISQRELAKNEEKEEEEGGNADV